MKASWNGYLSLGNLKVPVQLYSALRTTGPSFVQLHATDHSPTGRNIVCLKEGREISSDEVVRAVKKGDSYVEVTDHELAQHGEVEKVMTVRQFSDPCDIKPKHYDKPYYIVPAIGGELAYTLLRQAFVKANKVAVVTYVYYQRERLGLIIIEDGIMMLQQLRFASEIIPRNEIKTATLPQPLPVQVDVAVRLMERYSTPFYIDDYRHEQQDRINELIDRKARGLSAKKTRKVLPEATEESAVLPALEELLSTQSPGQLR